jgi:catechol 2,3-dioxygenase-like lactoylglutathione lyase family enzyme
LPATASWAQLAAPNEAGVSAGHLHMNVQDVEANKKMWVTMGAISAGKSGENEIIKIPGILILVRKRDSSGGSVGSVVNHVGVEVPNVQEAVAKWKTAGINVAPGSRPTQAYVTSPDGLRIEVLENDKQTVPLAMHHIHFNVPESAIPEIQAWYAKTFGAVPEKRGEIQGAQVPGTHMNFTKAAEPTVPTKGRVLDHIGFEVKGLEAFCKKLEASGIKLDLPYNKLPSGNYNAFITDPWGTYIELTEGLSRM